MKSRSMTVAKLLLLLLVLGVSVTFVVKGISLTQATEERELVDTTPKHVPIKIKVKAEKEKAFKDLHNDRWLRDLELEVKNVGDKPIYFILLSVHMDETKAPNGNQVGFPLHYGQLSSFKERPTPEDVPLKPGETHVFKVPEQDVLGWDAFRREENKPQPKKVVVIFQRVNFGDGTGYRNRSGSPFPNPRRKITSSRCTPASNKDPTDTRPPNWPLIALNRLPGPKWFTRMPATFLPASFLSTESWNAISFEPASEPADLCFQVLLAFSSTT